MAYDNEDPNASAPSPAAIDTAAPAEDDKPESTEATKAYITNWTKRIAGAKKFHEPAFKRMQSCMHIARTGGTKSWVGKDEEDGNYVAPIIKRHINQSVAQLYAKNPKSYAERKKRRMGTVWDGTLTSLQEAQQLAAIGDVNGMAIIEDAMQVQQYIKMMDGLADTLTILHEYFMNEQAAGYKQQFKALVRRTKVCGAGYVTLGFQRILEPNPDVTVGIEDATKQIASIEQLMAKASRDDLPEDSAKLEELRLMLADLQSKPDLIVREGPVLGFPKTTAVIIDPVCKHLKTLAGADWWAEEYQLSCEDIERIYKKDVAGKFKKYTPDKDAKPRWSEKKGEPTKDDLAMVWKVQQKSTGLEFTVCEGYDDYLKAPACPDVKIERFFTLFPLVFNEIEDEDEIFPPSDVWDARHPQRDYNVARQGLRDHRSMNKPGTYGPKGSLPEGDLMKLSTRVAGEHIEVGQLVAGEKLVDKMAAIPTVPIDPALYDVEHSYNDIMRSVGSQAANQGVTKGDTATETSIAEQSRMVSESSSVDDLDDMLTEIARSMGQLMLLELSKDTVMEIVGPGAVWPDMPQTRDEIVKDLTLNIRAGSSGRPNKAADLANMERGMPFIIQLPGVNPTPITERYLGLLDIDAEGAVVEGLPSIVAINAMMQKQAGGDTGGGDPDDPKAQGDKGGQNAPAAAGNEPGAQPAYSAPVPGNEPASGAPA